MGQRKKCLKCLKCLKNKEGLDEEGLGIIKTTKPRKSKDETNPKLRNSPRAAET
jgi:hypothetical protein